MSSFSELPPLLPALDRPALSLAVALRGHVTALVFWRVGCVHSRQALADLLELAGGFAPEPFAVVAVHVPTLPAERDRGRVRRALAAMGHDVTVVLDDDRALCRAMSVEALPTLALFDATGEACFVGAGEPNPARVRAAVEALLTMAEDSGRRARVPFVPPARPAAARLQPTALLAHGDALWVGSTGHGRVYRVGYEGRVERSVDGVAQPAGMCVYEGRLLVSDARRHRILALDLDDLESDVDLGRCGATSWTTMVGTGYRSNDRFGGSFGVDQGLCSPAGLLLYHGAVYCAQAGAHQLWQFDPETGAASSWIGSGFRQLRDGATGAAFAEPLAIAAAEEEFFVADADNGAIRRIALSHTAAHTHTRGLARPTAVAVDGDRLLVLAGWQPALLQVPRAGGPIETWFGAADGLVDPVAMTLAGGRLWIADAGADCLFVVDLAAAEPVLRRIDLSGWPPVEAREASADGACVTAPVVLLEHGDAALRVPLPPRDDGGSWGGLDCEVDVVDEASPVLATACRAVVRAEPDHLVVSVPVAGRGRGTLRLRVGGGARALQFLLPVEVAAAGATEVSLRPGAADAAG